MEREPTNGQIVVFTIGFLLLIVSAVTIILIVITRGTPVELIIGFIGAFVGTILMDISTHGED